VRSGHSPGTAAPESLAPQGRQQRAVDRQSAAPGCLKASVHAWPRLLSIEQAAEYLSVSYWTVREFINDGSIKAVPLPRPDTLRQRERRALGDTVRRLLIDRNDLDSLVESWKRRA
jgi:hypothetical protein